jgi:hypothetical protein
MLRKARGLLLVAVVVGLVPIHGAADEPPKKAAVDPRAPAMVPDRNWDPKPGDQAEIFGGDAPSSQNYMGFREWAKFTEAGDAVGKNGLYDRRVIIALPMGTHVLVVKRYSPPPAPSRTMTPEDYADLVISSSLNPPAQRRQYPLEVRVLDGEFKDQIRFVPEESVARMVPAPVAPKAKPKYQPRPADPATRAATTLRSAQNLEKAKKVPAALGIYRQVVQDYPGTPEAKSAAERIRALDGK